MPERDAWLRPPGAIARHWSDCACDESLYPPRAHWHGQLGYADYLQAVAGSRARSAVPARSLAIAIPAGLKGRVQLSAYLAYLQREIDMQARLLAPARPLSMLAIRCGTSQVSQLQIHALLRCVERAFGLGPGSPISCSLNLPPHGELGRNLLAWRHAGVSSLSLQVGRRDGTPAQIKAALDAARQAGFAHLAVRLECGVAGQDVFAFDALLGAVQGADPDQIDLVCGGAAPAVALDLHNLAHRRLLPAYACLGPHCYVRPDSELVAAQSQGRLFRTLQGYANAPMNDVIACGLGAVGVTGASYWANSEALPAYVEAIERNELPVAQGLRLCMDDLIRRSIIDQLICNGEVSLSAIELAFPIVCADYFAPELRSLAGLTAAGMLRVDAEWISVSDAARLLLPAIAAHFHAPLHQDRLS